MLKNTKIWKLFNKIFHYNDNKASILLDGFIAILIIVTVAITPLFFIDYFSDSYPILHTIEFYTAIIFTIEYIIRLWSSENRLRYIFSFSGIIDIIAIGPLLLSHYGIINTSIPLLLTIRLIRIIKLFFIYKNERDSIANNISTLTSHGEFEKGDNEEIIGIIQKHPIIFFFSLLPVFFFTTLSIIVFTIFTYNTISIIIALLPLLIAVVIFSKNWIDFHYDIIYITNKRLVISDAHIFGSDIITTPFPAIKEIHPSAFGIVNFFLNSGTFHIDTGAKEHAITFSNVANMKKMKALLLKTYTNQQQAYTTTLS